MGTFTTFAQGNTVIDFEQFSKAIDLYATMEVDNVDLDPTPFVTPSLTPMMTPLHSPMFSMDRFQSMDLKNVQSIDLGLNPSSMGSLNESGQSDTETQYLAAYNSYQQKDVKLHSDDNNNDKKGGHNKQLSSPSNSRLTNEMRMLLPKIPDDSLLNDDDEFKSKNDSIDD